jgi:thiamine pyrophosphate-dependent acetolactate synthase large subunit-like protein
VTRDDAIGLLCTRLSDEPVFASLGHPAYELFARGDRPLNFYTWGSMGLTTPLALGLALARPDRRVIALDGDGSLLMNLGTLATVASCGPANLVVVVLDNASYGTTGGQPTATAGRADLEAAARALGIEHTATVRSTEALGRVLDDRASVGGPWVVVAKVEESVPTAKPPLDCVYIKNRFMEALGAPSL